GLYPVPHSPRFDFAATAPGAEWIDALMRDARAGLAALPPGVDVVAHGDWRVQNPSLRGGMIDAVYDWDSLAAPPELGALADSPPQSPRRRARSAAWAAISSSFCQLGSAVVMSSGQPSTSSAAHRDQWSTMSIIDSRNAPHRISHGNRSGKRPLPAR